MKYDAHSDPIAFLVARAERSAFVGSSASAKVRDEQACRAVVAYAGLCHIISLLSGKELAGMVSVCFTGGRTPYIAFGSTIAEAQGSKERLRSLREREMRELNPGTDFQPERLATPAGRGRRRGHCAEGHSFMQCVYHLLMQCDRANCDCRTGSSRRSRTR